MIYLAMPYSDPNPVVRKEREQLFYQVQADLIERGYFVVSPLDKIHMCCEQDMNVSWEYWEQYSYALLKLCNKVILITAEGFNRSTGVKAELQAARELGIPIYMYNLDTRTVDLTRAM